MTTTQPKQQPRIRVVGARYDPDYANRVVFELLERLPALAEALDVALATSLHPDTRREFAEVAKWLKEGPKP